MEMPEIWELSTIGGPGYFLYVYPDGRVAPIRRSAYREEKQEKAVAQLQDQMFQLAIKSSSESGEWACQIQSFGKTSVAAGRTRASALAQVLKKCSDTSNAIHRNESDVKCDNE